MASKKNIKAHKCAGKNREGKKCGNFTTSKFCYSHKRK